MSIILTSRIVRTTAFNCKECKQNALSREPSWILGLCSAVCGYRWPLSPKFLFAWVFFFFGSSKWKTRLRIQGWELYSFSRVTTNDCRLGSLKQQKRIHSLTIPETRVLTQAVWSTVSPSQALGEDPSSRLPASDGCCYGSITPVSATPSSHGLFS